MNVCLRVVTQKDCPATETSLAAALQNVFEFSGYQLLQFEDYHKMPGHKVMSMKFEIDARRPNDIFDMAGSLAVWRTGSEVIYDIRQGSSMKCELIDWMHLEVDGLM